MSFESSPRRPGDFIIIDMQIIISIIIKSAGKLLN